MTALIWLRNDPYVCACAGTYRPVLSPSGKLVKTKEPAWRMAEQTRDPRCLQEHCRALSKVYRLGYQHHKMSRGSGAGYPDVHLWTVLRPDGGGGSAYAELKRMGKDPTAVQVRVMADLQDSTPGGRVYLVRPCCLLTGFVDELMAELAGRSCLYVKDGPAYTPVEIPDDAPLRPRTASAPAVPNTADPALRTAVRFRPRPLPGEAPEPFGPAVGYVFPRPLDDLESWLRGAGFAPANVPYPIRVIVGEQPVVHVQCRIGLARAGVDERVWRAGIPAIPFPAYLAQAAAERVDATTSQAAAEHLSVTA